MISFGALPIHLMSLEPKRLVKCPTRRKYFLLFDAAARIKLLTDLPSLSHMRGVSHTSSFFSIASISAYPIFTCSASGSNCTDACPDLLLDSSCTFRMWLLKVKVAADTAPKGISSLASETWQSNISLSVVQFALAFFSSTYRYSTRPSIDAQDHEGAR